MSAVKTYNGVNAFTAKPLGLDTREVNGMYTPNQIPQTNLVASYDPAHPSSYSGSGQLLNDLSGNGNNLTLYGGVESGYNASGWFNYDGVNDAAYLAGNTISGNQSVGGWYRITADNDFFQMIGGILGSSLEGIQVYYNCNNTNNRFFGRIEDASGVATAASVLESVYTVNLNTWYYVCVSWNNSTKQLNHYIFDSSGLAGSQSVTSTGIDTTSTASANIINGATTYWAYGYIGETHIYNAALSQADFTDIYNNTKARYGY